MEVPMGEPPTALVVEDDLMQRALVSILLEESDMRVIQCESAEAALVMLDRIGPRLAMIFTEVELAGDIDGIELAHQARERFPGLRIIVTSGAPRVRRLPDGTTFMAKPWMPLDVLREAQHALMH
jgi:DNA-binding NtrC family response regulator